MYTIEVRAGSTRRDGTAITKCNHTWLNGLNESLTPLHHLEVFPEDVAQKRRRFGHKPFAAHVAQMPSFPGVQRLVGARRRYHVVVVVDGIDPADSAAVLVHVHVPVVVVVVLVTARWRFTVVGTAEPAATAPDGPIPGRLTAAAPHDRRVRTGRGKLLEL